MMINELLLSESFQSIIVFSLLMVFGLLTRLFQALWQIKKGTGASMSFGQYYGQNRWHTLFAVCSAFAAFIILYRMDQMNETTAFTIGYMADAMADMLGQRSGLLRDKEKPDGLGK